MCPIIATDYLCGQNNTSNQARTEKTHLSYIGIWLPKNCVNPNRKPLLGIFNLQLDTVAVIFGSKWKEGVVIVSKKIVSYVSATQQYPVSFHQV